MANWLRSFLKEHPERADWPVVRRARHSIHFRRPDGLVEAHFTGAPMHYQDERGEWQPLDTALRDMGNGELGAPGVPVRITPEGRSRIVGGTFSQWTQRVGTLTPDPSPTAGERGGNFNSRIVLGGGAIKDDRLVTEGTFWRHELRLTETGLRETLMLTEMPPLTLDPSPTVGERGEASEKWLVLETVINGKDLPDGPVDAEWEADAMCFPPPRAWDANGEEAPCRRWARRVGGQQIVYTGVPVEWLARAAYPVVIDPDYAGDTADGWVRGQDATYATARTTSQYHSTSDASWALGQQYSGGLYSIFRHFLRFDTSAIPDAATILQVNLTLVVTSDYSSTDFDVQIVKQDWSAQVPLSTGNREAAYDNCLAGTQDASIWRNTSGLSINTPYTSGNLDTAWPSKTGYTYYSLRSSRDYAGTTPTDSEKVYIAFQNHGTPAYRPVLTITYLEPITGSGGVTVQLPALAGSGEQTFAGSGDIAVEPPALAAVGHVVPIVGSGAISAFVPGLAATGHVTGSTGAGGVSARVLMLAGAGAWTWAGLSRPAVVVEIGFSNPNQAPQWTEVSGYVREVHIRRGRQHERGQVEAGTASVVLDNRERLFDPTYEDGPYYGSLSPMRRLRISAVWGATVYRLFTGFIEAWPQRWGPGLDATVEVAAVDGFKALNLLKVSGLSAPQELSGARIQRILDTTGLSGAFVGEGYWVLGDPVAGKLGTAKLAGELEAFRFIDTGQSQVQADTIDETALAHMQKVAESEGGLLYIDGEGRLVFEDRHHRIESQGNPVATFGDAVDGTEWPYTDLTLSYDDSWIYNDVRVTRRGGTEQAADDEDSQDHYLVRTLELSDLLLVSDSEALSRAQALCDLYKEPSMRVESLQLEPMGLPALWPVALAREISQRVVVIRRPAGGAAVVRDYFIEAIRHDIANDNWVICWQLSPAPVETYWVLGNAEYGILGVTARLAQ